MQKDLKTKWVTALRSGKYKQGKEQLRINNGEKQDCFCCLGVLWDIDEEKEWVLDGGIDWAAKSDSGMMCAADLPYGYSRKIGLNKHRTTLVEMNDGIEGEEGSGKRSYTFNEIADWIEENV